MNFRGRAKRLDDIDIPTIGQLIGVGEDEVHAILDVESAGSGFDAQGRPKMLFEPHKFYALLEKKKLHEHLKRAVAAGVAYKEWKKTGYPKDSYGRLEAAMKINEEIGLQAASWGLPQIMGFNYKLAGYPSAKAMVTDFLDDEENHLRAMVNFINATGLSDELRRHDWRGFEDGYNGGGFGGAYAKKLKARFEHWQKIKDTPLKPEITQEPAQPASEMEAATVPSTTEKPAGGAVVGAGGAIVAGGAAVKAAGFDWTVVLAGGVGLAIAALIIFLIIQKRKSL